MEDKYIQIKSEALSLKECISLVSNPKAGAVVHFIGTVRNHTDKKEVMKLEFEAYEPMAIKEMKKIADQAKQQWPVLNVAIHHRVGVCEIGAIAVIITVSSAHRKAAFKACEFAIDTLKETVPIWKKEFFKDGVIWVNATP